MSEPLDHETIHVVSVRLDEQTFSGDVLDDAERVRAAGFVRCQDRRRFVAAHAATRLLLGQCLDVAPASIQFATTCHGKPRLTGGAIDIRFNLSHSGDRALLAIAVGREVGVDIEEQSPVNVLALADLVFSPRERVALTQVAPEARLEAFYRCWTRKESFIKATGEGLSSLLQVFEVGAGNHATELVTPGQAPGKVQRWTVVSLNADPGYSAALTVEGSGFRIISSDWHWSSTTAPRSRPSSDRAEPLHI